MKKIIALSLLAVSFNSYGLKIKDLTDKYIDVTYTKNIENESEKLNKFDGSYIQLKDNEKNEIYSTIKYYADAKSLENVLNKIRAIYSTDQRKIDLSFPIDNNVLASWHKKDIIHYITEFKNSSVPLLEVIIKNRDKFYLDLAKEDSYGNTPLFNACKSNDLPAVRLLLAFEEVRTKLNYPINKYKHPLYVANVYNYEELSDILMVNGALYDNEQNKYSGYKFDKQEDDAVNRGHYNENNNISNEEKDFKSIYTIDNVGQLHFTQLAQSNLYDSVVKSDAIKLENYLNYYNKLMSYTYKIFKVAQYLPAKLTYNYNNETTLFHIAINAKDHNILRILLKYRGIFNFDFYIKDRRGASIYDKVSLSEDNFIKNQFNSSYSNYVNTTDPYAGYSTSYNYSYPSTSQSKNDSSKNDSSKNDGSKNDGSKNYNTVAGAAYKPYPSYSTDSNTGKSSYYGSNYDNKYDNNFSGKKLLDANFNNQTLRNAKFVKSQLAGSNFSYASLEGADFTNADLTGADFTGADLSYVNLSGANLSGAKFKNARLFKTDLTRIILSKSTIFPESYEIILRDKDVVFNDNKVHKFAAASNFFQTTCNAGSCSASQAANAFEQYLADTVKEQKKARELNDKKVKFKDPESTYITPNLNELRQNREKFFSNLK